MDCPTQSDEKRRRNEKRTPEEVEADRRRKKSEKVAKKEAGAKRTGTQLKVPPSTEAREAAKSRQKERLQLAETLKREEQEDVARAALMSTDELYYNIVVGKIIDVVPIPPRPRENVEESSADIGKVEDAEECDEGPSPSTVEEKDKKTDDVSAPPQVVAHKVCTVLVSNDAVTLAADGESHNRQGSTAKIKIVTAAPNVELGVHTPVALPGAVIALRRIGKIQPQEVRGELSEGMFCDSSALLWQEKSNCPRRNRLIRLSPSELFPIGSKPPREPPLGVELLACASTPLSPPPQSTALPQPASTPNKEELSLASNDACCT